MLKITDLEKQRKEYQAMRDTLPNKPTNDPQLIEIMEKLEHEVA